MTILQTTFERAGELYVLLFGDWLHVHFIIRTAVLILVMWLAVYIIAQVFKFLIAPVLLLIFYHTIFRFWNFVMVETPQEWIYIRHHSKDSPKFAATYGRLSDKVKRNRQTLTNAKYSEIVRRVKPFTLRVMIISGIVATLWVASFGLHEEYFVPAMTPPIADSGAETGAPPTENPVEDMPAYDPHEDRYAEYEPDETYAAGTIDPSFWGGDEHVVLYLNELGQMGARLRDGPGIRGYSVIEILWDNDQLVYLGDYQPDMYVEGLYWLRVLSPSGAEGYISSQVVGVR